MATSVTMSGSHVTQIRTASGLDVLAGVWLIVAPFILNYATNGGSTWNDVLVGIGVAGFAGVQMLEGRYSSWASWANTLLAAWLIAAPFALNFTTGSAAMWNDIVVGAVVGLLSIGALYSYYTDSDNAY